jgi:smad nuclear-interacting protein 1
MPRRSPSPDSFKRYRDSNDRDKYRSRRDDAAGYRRNVDRESRDGYQNRRGYSERDTRRNYHNDNEFDNNDRRRRDDGDDRYRRKNGYEGHDNGGWRRDEGNRDDRYASRHDEGDDKSLMRGEYRGRGDRDRLRDDRDRRERGDERKGSSRRSASPRRSRPQSRSVSRSRSPSASPPPEDKTKPNLRRRACSRPRRTRSRIRTERAPCSNTMSRLRLASLLLGGGFTFSRVMSKSVRSRPSFLLHHRAYFEHAICSITRCFWDAVDLLHIHRQSAYLIGRDRMVTDIPLEHPSCSKQHAVIQCTLFHLLYHLVSSWRSP